MADLPRLTRALIRDEALRLKPYTCSKKKLTIGVGRNLDDVGITEQEAMYLLKNDIERLMSNEVIQDILAPHRGHNKVRAEVILNMAFNMGIRRFLGFKRTLRAFAERDYALTAEEMKDSRWYNQVGQRAVRLCKEMETGEKED